MRGWPSGPSVGCAPFPCSSGRSHCRGWCGSCGFRRAIRERDPEREERTIGVVARLSRASGGNCLARSLVLYRYLSRADADPRLVVGMAKPDEYLGHVWVTVDGRPLLETPETLRGYEEVTTFGDQRPEGRVTAPTSSRPALGSSASTPRSAAWSPDVLSAKTATDHATATVRNDDRAARRPPSQPDGARPAARRGPGRRTTRH